MGSKWHGTGMPAWHTPTLTSSERHAQRLGFSKLSSRPAGGVGAQPDSGSLSAPRRWFVQAQLRPPCRASGAQPAGGLHYLNPHVCFPVIGRRPEHPSITSQHHLGSTIVLLLSTRRTAGHPGSWGVPSTVADIGPRCWQHLGARNAAAISHHQPYLHPPKPSVRRQRGSPGTRVAQV